MRKNLISSLIGGVALAFSMTAAAADITGAGASFPYPIYSKWAEAYKAATGKTLNYQSIGSSGGLKQIRAKTVDFGASDDPVSAADLEKDGMVQFPAIMGGVVVIFNVPGVTDIKLDGELLADMFMGWIVNWNDPKIAALNPGVKLPDQTITVSHRADGSGTTKVFTDYLTKVSPRWKEKVGSGATVQWPAAASIGGKGNAGVAANVSKIKGALGYVEFAYAKQNKLSYATLKNSAGKFVMADDDTFAAAAAGADWAKAPGMALMLTNQPGEKSWPITAASFIIMYKQPTNAAASKETLAFFDWAFKNGGKVAADLDYVPMPAVATDFIRKSVWSQIKN